MKILLTYSKKQKSQSLVSSAFEKFKNNPKVGVELEILNISNRNILKYLIKQENEENSGVCNSLPSVIYVFEKEIELIDLLSTKYPSILIILYSENLAYKPERVPGNELPTIAYFLYDKIIYDYNSGYKKYNAYYVDYKNLCVEVKELSEFELKHPYAKVVLNGIQYYATREEAVLFLRNEINKRKLSKLERIQHKNIEMLNLQKQIFSLQDEIVELNRLEIVLKGY